MHAQVPPSSTLSVPWILQWKQLPDAAESAQIGLFGVFDGHGGTGAADYVHGHLFSNLMRTAKFATDPKAALGKVTAVQFVVVQPLSNQ